MQHLQDSGLESCRALGLPSSPTGACVCPGSPRQAQAQGSKAPSPSKASTCGMTHSLAGDHSHPHSHSALIAGTVPTQKLFWTSPGAAPQSSRLAHCG
jgi:hypothetical protein